MDDPVILDFWMQVQSILVEVEGMKAENLARQQSKHHLAYEGYEFINASCRIEGIRQEMLGYRKKGD